MSEAAAGSNASEWRHMWGAKVKWPADMNDDMLKSAIDLAKEHVVPVADWQNDGDEAVQTMKAEFDEKWEPYWHVVVGKDFGALVTHESRRFCYFYIEDKAFLMFKAG